MAPGMCLAGLVGARVQGAGVFSAAMSDTPQSGLFGDIPEAAPVQDGPSLFGDAAPAPARPAASILPEEPAPGAAPAAYRVLARKYRPTRFDDLIGQEAMVRILRSAFAQGRIAHAFMLTGVRGTGKTTTARIIARALNCIGADGNGGPTADPCGVCPTCRAILADRHPDVLEMDAASRTGVGDVREIIEATRFRPMEARTKVFIIDEVHMLSNSAFNALLKTLEEPPPHVKFVFATTEIRKVPVTVLSRCQRFDLRRIPAGTLAAHFAAIAAQELVQAEEEALAAIARAADGSVRDGLSLLDQAIAQAGGGTVRADDVARMLGAADRSQIFALAEAVLTGNVAAALALIAAAHAQGVDPGQVIEDLLGLTHMLTRLKTVPGLAQSRDLPEAERVQGVALAGRASIPVLGRMWQMLLRGMGEMETAPDSLAAAEMVLIRLCHVADLPPPGELIRKLENEMASRSSGSAGSGGVAGGRAAPGGASGGAPGAAPPAGAAGHGVQAQGPAGSAGAGRAATAMAGGMAAGAVAAGALAAGTAADMAADMAAGMALDLAAASAQAREPAAPAVLRSFRDVLAVSEHSGDIALHAHLLHSVHLVRFAPPVIELRADRDAPRDLAPRLAAMLQQATAQRWTIVLSGDAGEKTLAEQGRDADAQRRIAALQHPLVAALMQKFPGAKLEAVRDPGADAYGLPIGTEETAGAFAPDDAELIGIDDFPEID